ALVSAGVEPGIADYDGRTALHLAAAEGQAGVVRYLLAADADPQPVDRWGGTPLSDAEGNGHTEIAALLREHANLSAKREAAAARVGQTRGGRGMSGHENFAGRVVAVLLADGWHRIEPGSFSVGSLDFGVGVDLGVPGFRFEEADAGRPYQPTVLAGPVDSII